MKKSRIIRALKSYNNSDLKDKKICKFKDEKGKSYFLGEEQMYMEKISKGFQVIDFTNTPFINSNWEARQ